VIKKGRFLNYYYGLRYMTAQRIGNIGTLLCRIIKQKTFLFHTIPYGKLFRTYCYLLNTILYTSKASIFFIVLDIDIKLLKLKLSASLINDKLYSVKAQ